MLIKKCNMKKISLKLFITTLIVVFAINLNAKNVGKTDENNREYYRNLMRKEVESLVKYPDSDKFSNKEGFVLLKFKYLEKGSIEIIEINSSDEYLKEYIGEQLKKLPMCDHIIKSGKEFIFRFDFKKI